MKRCVGFAAVWAIVLVGCASTEGVDPDELGHAPSQSQTILDDSLDQARDAAER